MIAICGRISDINSVAKWGDLPSTKLPNLSNKDKPPMWLPRATFKSNVRAAKFQSWPVDPDTGLPIGGEDLKKAEEGRIKKNGALIGDAALDAVFDTWAWGGKYHKKLKIIYLFLLLLLVFVHYKYQINNHLSFFFLFVFVFLFWNSNQLIFI